MSLQRPLTIVILKTLAGAAALGALAYGAAVAATRSGLLPRGPLRTGVAVAVGGLVAMALIALLFKRAARRADANLLDPASELTTLTFPPTRSPRPRLNRAK
jgi:hypothetical protein